MYRIALALMLALSPLTVIGQLTEAEWRDRTVEHLRDPVRHGDQLTLLALCLKGYVSARNYVQEIGNESHAAWMDTMSNDLIAVALETYSLTELTQEMDTLEHSGKVLNLIGELMYPVSSKSVTSVLHDHCDVLVYGSVDGAPEMPSISESVD